MDEPMLSRLDAGVRRRRRATTSERPGRWVAEPSWPSPNIETEPLAFNAGGLGEHADADEAALPIRSPLERRAARRAIGAPMARRRTCPTDQREDDGKSLCLRHRAAVTSALEILGAPVVDARARRRQAAGAGLRPPQRRGARRRVAARQLRPAEPDPSRQPRASPSRWSRASATACAVQLNDIAHAFPGPSHPHRRLHLLLADRLAVAGNGDGHALRRRQPAGAAGSRAAGRGRKARRPSARRRSCRR